MWLTAPNRMGIAAWQCGDSVWRIQTRGHQRGGIELCLGSERLQLVASGDKPLPALDEQFVRSDELHWSFPQSGADCEFGFRLVVRPVTFGEFDCGPERAAFELLLSVQTTLLDSHPTLDLIVPAGSSRVRTEVAAANGTVHLTKHAGIAAAVVLGPQDAPFTSQIEDSAALRLRLFGEFLEKGVIRRARPWVILDRSATEIDPAIAEIACQALAESPLPLR